MALSNKGPDLWSVLKLVAARLPGNAELLDIVLELDSRRSVDRLETVLEKMEHLCLDVEEDREAAAKLLHEFL